MTEARREPRPEWLRITIRTDESFVRLRSMVSELRLNTVCQEARCPNIYECWNAGTATFMILGDTCTRYCGFCNVNSGKPKPGVDAGEPAHVAEAVARLALKHAVVTSVDRDDLADGGARHFADVVGAIQARVPTCAVEVLTPDFKKKPGALDVVLVRSLRSSRTTSRPSRASTRRSARARAMTARSVCWLPPWRGVTARGRRCA
jgi:lipoic acid synthetase